MKTPSCFIAVFLATVSLAAAETKPYILIILADDMGYSDSACFGGEL